MTRRELSGRRTRALSAAAAVSLVAVPALALSACGTSGSQALESLASRASSAIASATSALPSATTEAPTTSEPAPTTSRATSFSPLTTSASTTSTPTTNDPTTTTQTPTRTETTTATQTATRTATTTTTTTVTPTTPSPTSTTARPTSASPSPSGSTAPAPAGSGTPWLPWVIGLAVLLLLGLVGWLVARARTQRAWRDQLRATTGSFDQLTSTFLPRLVANPADPSLPGTWSVVRPQVAEAVRAVDALAVSAPDEAARATVIALGDAVRSTSGAVDVCLTPGTVIDPASVQEVIRRRDALVAATGAARTLAGPPSGGAHA